MILVSIETLLQKIIKKSYFIFQYIFYFCLFKIRKNHAYTPSLCRGTHFTSSPKKSTKMDMCCVFLGVMQNSPPPPTSYFGLAESSSEKVRQCTVQPPDLYDPSFNRDFTAKKKKKKRQKCAIIHVK